MKKILIIGNPNTGKTTLFNTITKSSEKVANYTGVTVKEKEKEIKFKDSELKVVDLPGLYSTKVLGEDEVVALDYIKKNKDCKIIYVATTADLSKNMKLFTELTEKGYNLSLFINEVGARIKKDNVEKIQEKLNIPIYCGDARKSRKDILGWIFDSVVDSSPIEHLSYTYDEIVRLFDLEKLDMQKIDKILLHPIFGRLTFFVILILVYYISFVSVGEFVGDKLISWWNSLGTSILIKFAGLGIGFINDFFQVVVIDGIGPIIAFLPELFLILFCMYILEESGYLPRVAYLFNVDLSKVGMSGKSVFGMSVGIGCTTSGYLTTRNIDDAICRKQTSSFLPFIGCSAKLPIVLFLAEMLLGKNYLIIGMVYLISIFAGLALLKLTAPKKEAPFIIELPRLKVPSSKTLIKESLVILKDFFKRVVGSILIVLAIVWVLMNIEFKFNGEIVSVLDVFLSVFVILFKPIGLGTKSVVLSLFTGLIAKENILSSLAMYDGYLSLSIESAVSFMIFVLLYSPCIPALRCARVEFGTKYMWKTFLTQMIFAYLICLVFYTFASIGGVWIGGILSAVFLYLGLKLAGLSKNKFTLNCKNCKRKA